MLFKKWVLLEVTYFAIKLYKTETVIQDYVISKI